MIRTTFQARPTFSMPPMIHADGSISYQRRPWAAERGNAWWLWCHASPSDGSASHATLVEWSSMSKRRRPKKWHTELIDHVTWCRRKMRTRPPQMRPRRAPSREAVQHEAESGGTRSATSAHSGKSAVDAPHPRVLVELPGVPLPVRLALRLEQPADVRVKEAPEAVAVADVRGVRVALLVGVRVVLAVVGDPVEHRALQAHRAEHGEGVLDRLVGLEGAMGEHPVEADRDAGAVEEVGHREIPRSIQSTHWFHSSTTAAMSPRKGTTTPIRLAMRSALVMPMEADAQADRILVRLPPVTRV